MTNQSASSHKSGLFTRMHARTRSEEKKHSTFEKHDSTLRKQLPVKTSVHELQAAPGGDIAYVFSAGSRIKGAVGFVPCCH